MFICCFSRVFSLAPGCNCLVPCTFAIVTSLFFVLVPASLAQKINIKGLSMKSVAVYVCNEFVLSAGDVAYLHGDVVMFGQASPPASSSEALFKGFKVAATMKQYVFLELASFSWKQVGVVAGSLSRVPPFPFRS